MPSTAHLQNTEAHVRLIKPSRAREFWSVRRRYAVESALIGAYLLTLLLSSAHIGVDWQVYLVTLTIMAIAITVIAFSQAGTRSVEESRQTDATAAKQINRATVLYEDGHNEDAINLFEKASTSDNVDLKAVALVNAGLLQESMERGDESGESWRKAIAAALFLEPGQVATLGSLELSMLQIAQRLGQGSVSQFVRASGVPSKRTKKALKELHSKGMLATQSLNGVRIYSFVRKA